MKRYYSSPLPFQGQKRYFARLVGELIDKRKDIKIVVDLFGGSGILSQIAIQTNNQLEVIYNDYDNFQSRLNQIPMTNDLLKELRCLLGPSDNKRIQDVQRSKVLDIIKRYADSGYNDYITLGANLLFSSKTATSFEELSSNSIYNNIKTNDYSAKDYLSGVTIVRKDYRELFNEYRDNPNVLFLLDPPYLSTDISTYNMGYWTLSQYLDVLLLTCPGINYIYFTSSKSHIIPLCDWIKKHPGASPLSDSRQYMREASINKQSVYQDYLLTNI